MGKTLASPAMSAIRAPLSSPPLARTATRLTVRLGPGRDTTQYIHKGRLLGWGVDDRCALVRELFRRQLSRRLRSPVERRGRRTRGQLRRAGAGAEGGREPARPLLRAWAPCATAGAARPACHGAGPESAVPRRGGGRG